MNKIKQMTDHTTVLLLVVIPAKEKIFWKLLPSIGHRVNCWCFHHYERKLSVFELFCSWIQYNENSFLRFLPSHRNQIELDLALVVFVFIQKKKKEKKSEPTHIHQQLSFRSTDCINKITNKKCSFFRFIEPK